MPEHTNPIIQIAASDELLQRGCVNLIGLEQIKSEVGPRWEKAKGAVSAKLESLLRQKLSATDFYTQIDDTSFLVSMPGATSDESQIFCLRTAHELHTSLLGNCEIGKLQVSSVTSVQQGAVAGTAIAGPQLAALARTAGLEGQGPGDVLDRRTMLGPVRSTPERFSYKFVPIWDAQQEAVTTYRCVTAADQGISDTAGLDVLAKLGLAVTIARITHAAAILGRHLEAEERFLMWIPVAFDVLTSPVGRMEIAGVCRNLASNLRPYLIFEVSDLPYGVPQSRLSELVGSLRPFCRGVVAHLPARIPNYGAYLGAGLQAIGLSFSSAGVSGTEMESEIFKLSFAAKRQRVKSFVFDVPHHDILRSARELGINYISGPLIGEALNAPMPVKRLLMRDIPVSVSAQEVAA